MKSIDRQSGEKSLNTEFALFVYSLSHWAAKEPAKHRFMAGNTDHWAKMKHKVGTLEILTVNWYHFSVFISKRSNRAFERLSGRKPLIGNGFHARVSFAEFNYRRRPSGKS